MGTVTIGSNLETVERGGISRRISRGLRMIGKYAEFYLSQAILDDGGPKVFTKAGAPATNTAADSPGSDLCIVIDTTNSDIYLLHTWTDSTHFTSTKIVD